MHRSRSATAVVRASESLLREQVRLLGANLGQTLRTSVGDWLFDLVEAIRRLAKAARAGDPAAATALRAQLAALPTEQAAPLARSFAHFNALANIAESRQRARAWATGAQLGGNLRPVLAAELAAGATAETLHAAIAELSIELVFTAHPTQALRRTILSKHARIAEALEARELAREADAAAADRTIAAEIAAAWHTDDIRQARPSPIDEARAGLVVFEQVLWDAVPAFLGDLDAALVAETGRGLAVDAAPVRFGSWIGGDRDGNPNVTAVVTEAVCWLARWQAAELYQRELCRLGDELSIVVADDALRALAGGAHEPYRAVIKALSARLTSTQRHALAVLEALQAGTPLPNAPAELLLDVAELQAPLDAMARSLHACGLALVADGRLRDLRRRAAVFGLTLVRLDVRQASTVHTTALDAITQALGLGAYASWDEPARQAFLLTELASARPLLPRVAPDDPVLAEVLATMAACASQGPGSLGAYVISMAGAPSDVLAVELLQRELGVTPPMRVVPLFETLADLDSAPRVVDALLALRPPTGKVEIMIGYSDSAKDAGRVASAWALYRTQEALLQVAAARGVGLTLFHGRGGTIARGGGPIALAIRSQPPGTVRGGLRVTVQGESIDVAFGLPETARQTLELYVGAVLASIVRPPPAPLPAWQTRMDRMATIAARSYREVLAEPGFVPYFETATPEAELALINIGSRPARRGATKTLADLRAIPWSFAWTQNRLLLPAWLGTDVALASASDEPARAELAAMLAGWPFFAALVDLFEMVLAKADPALAAGYDELLVPAALQPLGARLRDHLARTRAGILALRERGELLADNDLLRWSIAVRHPYIDPLNMLQAELLRRLRAAPTPDRELVAALTYTITGIAAGMRNTG